MTSVDPSEPGFPTRETLLAYEAPPPPDDMADRVLTALRAETRVEARPGSARRRLLAAAALVAAAAVAAVPWCDDRAAVGHRATDRRESIEIGRRAVAVAEPGSEIAWRVGAGGDATVRQPRGDIFYRVEPGRSFAVLAPGATVRVLGTCFRVEVRDMQSRNKLVAAGATGAALSAAVLVTVYEGRVLLGSDGGQVELGPGQRGTVVAGSPPTASDPAGAAEVPPDRSSPDLESRIRSLEQSLREAKAALAQARASAEDTPPPIGFDTEERDPAWAPAQEQRIQDRLTRFVGIEDGHVTVECRRTCCQLALDRETWARVQDPNRKVSDLVSDVGLGHFSVGRSRRMDIVSPDETDDGRGRMTYCMEPADLAPHAPNPDRGAERQALLAASRPAVDACMRDAAAPLDLVMNLEIDPAGEIRDILMVAEPFGHPAAECVERALVAAARFAPSYRATAFSITLNLVPLR